MDNWSLNPGWNLISSTPDPPVPTAARVLTYLSAVSTTGSRERACFTARIQHAHRAYADQGHSASSPARPVWMPISKHAGLWSPLHWSGWNWIGYLPRVSMLVTTALQSIEVVPAVRSEPDLRCPPLPQAQHRRRWLQGIPDPYDQPRCAHLPETSGSSTATAQIPRAIGLVRLFHPHQRFRSCMVL